MIDPPNIQSQGYTPLSVTKKGLEALTVIGEVVKQQQRQIRWLTWTVAFLGGSQLIDVLT